YAVDLLLDGRDHRRGDDVGAGARILSADVDDRRGNLRVLRDRQAPERHAAEDHDHHRQHACEDGTVDEKVRDAHGPGFAVSSRWSRPTLPGRTCPTWV